MRPSKLAGSGTNMVMKDTSPEAESVAVHYRMYKPVGVPTIGKLFYLHGNRGNMNQCEWEIESFVDLGYEVWTMDYRGFGDSTGPMSEQALIDDARRVFELFLESSKMERVVVWGRSFGSGVASAVVAQSKVKPTMLVLETPYWSLMDAVRQSHPYLPPFVFRYELPTYRYIETAGCPIHLIHGTRDEKIPSHSSDRLHERCRELGGKVQGHSVMCGMHNLRDTADFKRIANSIL
jgi:alpha-beta hydrolase superfamily lysophospholipase